MCCCWYHKGTNFQANHNSILAVIYGNMVVADTTKVRIFKQITTNWYDSYLRQLLLLIPQRYEFSSKSQLNWYDSYLRQVVADTTKVRIFKQITTNDDRLKSSLKLLLIPQRYEFSSKSQHKKRPLQRIFCCCWYHKGTNFQANHNRGACVTPCARVVADTTKVRIFKQITTRAERHAHVWKLLLIPQRYEFSSKSQRVKVGVPIIYSCCWYHKGTNFQANHNPLQILSLSSLVVADTTKVRIFKQITTVTNINVI